MLRMSSDPLQVRVRHGSAMGQQIQTHTCTPVAPVPTTRAGYPVLCPCLVGLVALLSGVAGALSLPAFVPLLCTLFPTTPCEGLAFTYTLLALPCPCHLSLHYF